MTNEVIEEVAICGVPAFVLLMLWVLSPDTMSYKEVVEREGEHVSPHIYKAWMLVPAGFSIVVLIVLYLLNCYYFSSCFPVLLEVSREHAVAVPIHVIEQTASICCIIVYTLTLRRACAFIEDAPG